MSSRLADAIPAWVDVAALDRWTPAYGYPGLLPPNAAGALIAAAHEHQAALAPATADEVHAVLLALRTSTMVRDEHVEETDAHMRLLRAHLADVPLDILEAGCRAYCQAPGKRYFPRAAGELRAFTNPLVRARTARAAVLERLAKQAHDEQAERDRLAADPLTPEMAAEILAEFGLGPSRGSTIVETAAHAAEERRAA